MPTHQELAPRSHWRTGASKERRCLASSFARNSCRGGGPPRAAGIRERLLFGRLREFPVRKPSPDTPELSSNQPSPGQRY